MNNKEILAWFKKLVKKSLGHFKILIKNLKPNDKNVK